MKKIKQYINKIPYYYYILFVMSCVMFISNKGEYFGYGDDFYFHYPNVLAMCESASLFKLPPKILHLMAYGFGYGTGIFYPRFMHLSLMYMIMFLRIFNFTDFQAMNIFLLLFTFIISIFMRKLLYKYTLNENVSTLGAILYIYCPYFISDIFIRFALGELIIFLSLPLIFLGLYYLFNEDNKKLFYIYFVIGFVLLFSSHVISSLYVIIFTGFYLLFNGKKLFKKKYIVPLLIASLFSLFISLDNLYPILEHKLFGNYYIFYGKEMSSRDYVLGTILNIKSLFFFDDRIQFFIPIFMYVLIIMFITNYKSIKKIVDKKILQGNVFIFVTSVLLVVVPFIWKIVPDLFLNIQFTWRLCSFICFSAIILSSFGLMTLNEKTFKVVYFICLISSLSTMFYIKNNPYYVKKNLMAISVERNGLGVNGEYLPTNTRKNLKYFNNRGKDIKFIKGEGIIKLLDSNESNLKFSIDIDKKSTIELPKLYYLWYEINFTSNDGDKYKIDYYENDKGFIELKVNESGIINLEYKQTLIATIMTIISIFSIIGYLIFLRLIK